MQRYDKVNRAVKLKFSALLKSLDRNIHWTPHPAVIRDVDRLIRDQRISELVKDHLGYNVYNHLQHAINVLAAGQTVNGEKLFDFARGNAHRILLGANLKTAVQQFAVIPQMASEMGLGTYMKAMNNFIAHPREMVEKYKTVMGLSPTMKSRLVTSGVQIKGIHLMEDKLTHHLGNIKNIVDTALFFPVLNAPDIAITLPVWCHFYETELKKNGGSSRAAVIYADERIAFVQPVGRAVDKSYVQSSSRYCIKNTKNYD